MASSQLPLAVGSMLVSVIPKDGYVSVALPPALAVEAAKNFLHTKSLGRLVMVLKSELVPTLFGEGREGMWCVLADPLLRPQLVRIFAPEVLANATRSDRLGQELLCLWFADGTLDLLPSQVRSLKRSLEQSKEDSFQGEEGVPMSWVPVDSPEAQRSLLDPKAEEDKRTCVEDMDALEALDLSESPEPDHAPLTNAAIHAEFERIRQHTGLPSFPLSVLRSDVNKNGYVTGRVFAGSGLTPRRMVITLCPNADLAEVAATLVHEFAHLHSAMEGHGRNFKEAMVSLAAAIYGDAFQVESLARLDRSFHVLDMWVATGIRAALRQAEPPVAKEFDERLTASVVSRIQKMRALAADKPGTPEAVTATGIANTQVTLYDLGGYQLRVDATIDEQMVDRWINIGKRVRWKRKLAYRVADFCHVFALSRPDKGWVHFFGKYRDIVAAEYLYGVCREYIERQCKRHIQAWKARRRKVTGGEVRSEKTSFCTSAVKGISDKMAQIRELEEQQAMQSPDGTEAQGYRLTSHDMQRAQQFAADEHEKRGLSWSNDGSATYTHNASGYEAGAAVELHSGVGGRGPRGLLNK